MMPRCTLLLGLLALSAAAAAQQRDDSVRLDDFALPPSENVSVELEQIPAMQAVVEKLAEPRDRSIEQPDLPAERETMVGQLTDDRSRQLTAQVTSRADARPVSTSAVSSTSESLPGAVSRLEGEDRCDPQNLAGRERDECSQILELRAQEFNAREAPRLSPEETLLAEQRRSEEALAESSTATRLRFATGSRPDADLQSNQELASIFLEPGQSGTEALPDEAPEESTLITELLQGIITDLATPPE